MGFNDNDDRYIDIHFSSRELVHIMPRNCGHDEHLFRTIDNHAKASIPLVGRSIAQQFIHNYMEQALMDGSWNAPEDILPGLFTYIGMQKYQPSPYVRGSHKVAKSFGRQTIVLKNKHFFLPNLCLICHLRKRILFYLIVDCISFCSPSSQFSTHIDFRRYMYFVYNHTFESLLFERFYYSLLLL